MFLETMRTTDFDPNKKYTFVVPLGSTEQHGPFMALGADSFLGDKIITESAAAFPDIIFLPMQRITCSEEHEGFFGSVWLTKETMQAMLRDICQSIAPYAKTIAFASFHGGNLELLDQFVADNKDTFNKVTLLHIPTGSEETEERMRQLIGGPTDEHAGNVELSMVLACDESYVDIPPADYPKQVIENPFRTNHLKDFSADGIADNHPQWVVSKANGEKMIAWAVEDFKNELKKIA